jgi:DNA primase
VLSPDSIARVKERTDIVALIGETVRLQRRGRSFLGLCPFHKEKSPSFHVHPERGFYHCFGCGESGSGIDFAMKTNGLDFVEAVRMLAERAGIALEETRGDAAKARELRSERDELFSITQLAATYYERMLGLSSEEDASRTRSTRHPSAHHALSELGRRGMPDLTSGTEDALRWRTVLAAFRVGYAPPSWDGLAKFLEQQGASLALAERVGLLVAGQRGRYDRFRHRLMFAVVDVLGRVVAFSGRALPAPSTDELARLGPSTPSYDGEPPAKYINSPESPIYTKGEHLFGIHQAKQAIRTRGEGVLVEGNFDVVSLHARGIDHVVAPLGTAFTPEQAKLLKRFAPTAVLLFDGDAAGRKATRAARVPCREGGLDAKVATLPRGVDPDDFVRTRGAAALLAVLKDARGLLEYLIQEALDGEGFAGASLAERVARVRAVAKLLSEENDPSLRLMAKRFADQLSSKVVVGDASIDDLRELERTVERALSSPAATPARREGYDDEAGVTGRVESADERVARNVIGALLDFPELLLDEAVANGLEALEADAALAAVAVQRMLRRGADVPAIGRGDVADFLATLPRSIQKFAAGRLASPNFENAADAKAELLENTTKLRSLRWQRENKMARGVLERTPSSLDDESAALLRDIEERARRKRGLTR